MDRTFPAAVALTLLSVVGYAVGAATPYPGREVTLAGVMVGVTLAAVTYGRTPNGSEPDPPATAGAATDDPNAESTPEPTGDDGGRR